MSAAFMLTLTEHANLKKVQLFQICRIKLLVPDFLGSTFWSWICVSLPSWSTF